MVETTILRVKRRRDEYPPPKSFKVQAVANQNIKRARQKENEDSDTLLLSHMMHNSTLLNMRNHEQLREISERMIADSNSLRNTLSGDSTTSATTKKTILFRKINPENLVNISQSNGLQRDDSTSLFSSMTAQNYNSNDGTSFKRKADVVRVVDARLRLDSSTSQKSVIDDNNSMNNQLDESDDGEDQQQPTKKRKKISLHITESRTMTKSEFWKIQQSVHEHPEETDSTTDAATGGSTNFASNQSKISRAKALRERMKLEAQQRNNANASRPATSVKRNIVLDPLSKLIDDSLSSLFHSNTHDSYFQITRHIELIKHNANPSLFNKYLNWKCTSGGGTILHATAILNSIEGAQYLCSSFADNFDWEVKDSEGHSALEVAELTGTIGVSNIFSSFFHAHTALFKRDIEGEERDNEFVFDVYCVQEHDGDDSNVPVEYRLDDDLKPYGDSIQSPNLDENDMTGDCKEESQRDRVQLSSLEKMSDQTDINSNTPSKQAQNISDDESSPEVEMHGGVGYWDEHGQLVLETEAFNGGGAGFGSDIEDEEEDYDSNCEGHDANDYPDEYYNSDGIEDESEYDNHFRNRPITLDNLNNFTQVGNARGYGMYTYSDNYDEGDGGDSDDGEYRGHMNIGLRRWSNERLYDYSEHAYDPDFDDD